MRSLWEQEPRIAINSNRHQRFPTGTYLIASGRFDRWYSDQFNPMPKVSNSLRNKTANMINPQLSNVCAISTNSMPSASGPFFDHYRRSKRPTAIKCVPFGNKNRQSKSIRTDAHKKVPIRNIDAHIKVPNGNIFNSQWSPRPLVF